MPGDPGIRGDIASYVRSELLISLFDEDGLWHDRFPASQYQVSGRSSGSEGIELALRLALESRWDHRRMAWYNDRRQRRIMLAFEGAWHGWTTGALSLINRRYFRQGLVDGHSGAEENVQVAFLPFGETEILEDFFRNNKDKVLAVVVEPIQGDAGIVVPPPGFLQKLADLCRTHATLLIADEVLTFAKTGEFFALNDDGPVASDIPVIGKSIGFGVTPLSMVIAKRELAVRPIGGVATSDLRPLACAVVKAGIDCLMRQGLLQRSRILGELLREQLKAIVLAFPRLFSDTRGQGYLHGIELTKEAAPHARSLRLSILEHGAFVEIMSGAGIRSHGLPFSFPAIRVSPPLIADENDIDAVCASIAAGAQAFIDRGK